MKRLIAIEWTKLYHDKKVRIFTLLYFVLLIIFGVVIAQVKPSFQGLRFDLAQLGFFDYPAIWQNFTFFLAFTKLFLGVIIIMNITNEYTFGTLKQNLIDGLTKKEFIQAKNLTNILLALASTAIVLLLCLGVGLFISDSNTSFYQGIEYIVIYFVKLLFYFSFLTFLSVLLKKSVFVILAYFAWWIIELVLLAVEFGVRGSNGNQDSTILSHYLPLNASFSSISMNYDITGILLGNKAFNYSTPEYHFIVTILIYTVVLTLLSNWLLKRRDL